MQKIFGIAVIVGLIWLGLSVFMEGTQATFAWLPWIDTSAPADPAPIDRLRATGEAARDAAEQRVTRQLGETRAADEGDDE